MINSTLRRAWVLAFSVIYFGCVGVSQGNWRPAGIDRLIQADRLIQSRKIDDALVILRQDSKDFGPGLERCWLISTALLFQGKRVESLENTQQCGYPPEELQKRMRLVAKQFLTEKGAQLFQRGKDLLLVDEIADAREAWLGALDVEAENAEILARLYQLDQDRGEHRSAAKFRERLLRVDMSELESRTYGPAPQPSPLKKSSEENRN